jgi:hypothetical protein
MTLSFKDFYFIESPWLVEEREDYHWAVSAVGAMKEQTRIARQKNN